MYCIIKKVFGWSSFVFINVFYNKKGIWLARDKEMPLLIMDVEGSDSKERWDERNVQTKIIKIIIISLVL